MTDDQGIWTSLLKSTNTTTKTPSGVLLILGANKQTRPRIIESLNSSDLHNNKTNNTDIGIFGYYSTTYKDKHDFTLSQLDIYTLDTPVNDKTDTHQLLLKHVISQTKNSNKKLLICIAIDALTSIRDSWMNQLITWINMIRVVTSDMDTTEQINSLRKYHQQYLSSETTETDQNIEIPLAESQYDDPIGVDLLITLVGVESHMEQYGSTDDSLDLAQQVFRLISLKHGGSIIYLPGSSKDDSQNNFLSMISEVLEIPVKVSTPDKCAPSVIDSELIAVPRGWDTKGKIMALGNNFPFDDISNSWTNSSCSETLKLIQSLFPEDKQTMTESPEFPTTVPIEKMDWQKLLEEQYTIQEEKLHDKKTEDSSLLRSNDDYNMAGIRVEAMDQVARRLKHREQVIAAERNAAASSPNRSSVDRDPTSTSADQNAILANFFQNLLDKNPAANLNT